MVKNKMLVDNLTYPKGKQIDHLVDLPMSSEVKHAPPESCLLLPNLSGNKYYC